MRLFGALERKSTDVSALSWDKLLGGIGGSKAGVSVNLDSALKVSTVLACVRVIAEDLAQLPLRVYRTDGRSRKPAEDLQVYDVLNSRPNEWMTSFEFVELMLVHAVLTFNAYAYIGWGGGEVQELIPIVDPVRVERRPDYAVEYHLTSGEVLQQESVFHLRGPSWSGLVGMDALHLAREAIGLAIATEETHARLFANGAQTGGVLSIDGKLSPESRDRLETRAKERLEGIRNAFSTIVLDQNAKWQSMAMTGVDSQHLDTRRWQAEEICRGMRVYPQMVGINGDRGAPTFASAEQMELWHVKHTLMPWGRRFEQKSDHSLLLNKPGLATKFNFAALMRGDAAQRATFYEKALGGARGETAYMTRNEVRELEELDPIEGGDELPVPLSPTTAPPIIDTNPDPLTKSADYHREFFEAIRAMPAPTIEVNVPVSLPKPGSTFTKVTKTDATGRIQEFERHPIED